MPAVTIIDRPANFMGNDASATDLVVHLLAVALVIVANRTYGARLLRGINS
jgi:hypothetical protein